MRNCLPVLFLFGFASANAQLVFPPDEGWRIVDEGKNLSFTVGLKDNKYAARFSLEGPEGTGIQIDSVGHFSWTPSYDLVDRNTHEKEITVIFQADTKEGKRVRQPVNFVVRHVNRAPVAGELPVFYVRQGVPNKFRIPTEFVYDPDGDPVVFRSRESQMPEGAELTSLGQFSWTPSRSQFAGLKGAPLTLEFVVQDQPDKAETVGKILIAQTQLDLPPELLIVPADSVVNILENQIVFLKIYVSDPNGDDNIEQVDFICSDIRIPKTTLKINSKNQAEFAWTPGYEYVEESMKTKEVLFTFFAFDKSSNRAQRKVKVIVTDTENVEEKDRVLQQKYVGSLGTTHNFITLLDENNEELEKVYKKARKGKKSRTVINASLGAITGFSPLVLDPDPAKTISVVGGTSVLTLNSLEAGQVIGKNVNDYQNKIKTNRDLRTQLQLKGNYFARKYALKSARRSTEFEQDRDDLNRLMNSDAVTSLGLSAAAKTAPPPKEIKKTFADFSEE